MIAHPLFLLLLLPLTGFFIRRLTKKPAAITLSSLSHFKETDVTFSTCWRHRIPYFFYFCSGILMTIALARPQQGTEIIERTDEGIDIVLALDVSASMLEFDPAKGTPLQTAAEQIKNDQLQDRITVAIQEINKFIGKRPSDRIGIILFAGKAFSLAPPTKDHDFLIQALEKNDYQVIQKYTSGTNLAAPIALAVEHLQSSPAPRRITVLFTDGANTVNDEFSPEEMAQLAADKNIAIYTVGIGSDTPLAISRGISFFGGNQIVRSRNTIDEDMMKRIADTTQARYLKASDANSFQEVMESINRMEKVEIEDPVFVHYKELFHYFLWGAAACMAIGILFENTISLKVP